MATTPDETLQSSGTTAAPLKVLIADDHPLWRDAIERDLTEAGINVVGAVPHAQALVVMAQHTRPDVVLTDLRMPGQPTTWAIAQLSEARWDCRILVLSASGEEEDVLAAVKAGAHGYLTKSTDRATLLEAIERCAAGHPVFTPGLAGMVLGDFRQHTVTSQHDSAAPALTGREVEVLKLVALGLSYKQVAEQLGISHRTVQNHVRNTLEKLHLSNRSQLVRYAIAEGLDES